jgi:hypothetical protein
MRSLPQVLLVLGLMITAEAASAAGWLNIECVDAQPVSSAQGPITTSSRFGIDLDRSLARMGSGDVPIKVEGQQITWSQTLALDSKQQLNLQWSINRTSGRMVSKSFVVEGGKSTLHEQRVSNCKGLS